MIWEGSWKEEERVKRGSLLMDAFNNDGL